MVESGKNQERTLKDTILNGSSPEQKDLFGVRGIIYNSPISAGIRAVITNSVDTRSNTNIPLMKFVIRKSKFSPFYYKNWFNYTEVTALIRLLQRCQAVMEECHDGTLDLQELLSEDEDFGLRLNNMPFAPGSPFEAITANALNQNTHNINKSKEAYHASLDRAKKFYLEQKDLEDGIIRPNTDLGIDPLLSKEEEQVIKEEIDREKFYK
jgi:hypothetical protein